MSRIVLLLLLVFAAVSPALAAKRVALVIGNSAYTHVTTLANPVNDANLIAAALTEAGFDVIKLNNLDQVAMKKAMLEFGRRLREGAEASMFYYAGHGVQVNGLNYLVPVDADMQSEDEVDLQTVRVDAFLSVMESSGSKVNIVVFDACRNNPFRSFRSTGGGLAGIVAPRGTYVAYATAPGRVAADGANGNSPYTAALAKSIRAPGLKLEDVFKKTRAAVLESTRNEQVPWETTSITGDFFFQDPAAAAPLTPPPAVNLASDFDLARSLASLESWDLFLKRHGQESDLRVDIAREEIKKFAVLALAKPPPPPSGCGTTMLASVGGAQTCLKPGDEFADCLGCPDMVVVPAGRFLMGSPATEALRDADEGPQREMISAQHFAVGKFEVTFDEWAQCARGGGCQSTSEPDDAGFGRGRRPVINVSWADAQEYTRWLSSRTGRSYRLLSEAEWEYAARAGSEQAYSTGKTITKRQANFQAEHTVDVGKFPANAFGLYDMHGNVWEWTDDCYGPYASTLAEIEGCQRVHRSGGWGSTVRYLRAAYRGRDPASVRNLNLGFRVARTLP